MLRTYRYGDLTIGSRVVFPELPESPDSKPSTFFALRRARMPRANHATRVHEWRTREGQSTRIVTQSCRLLPDSLQAPGAIPDIQESRDGALHTVPGALDAL